MSERVCYIRRTDRGARLVGLELIGERAHERWEADPVLDSIGVESTISDGSDWIRQRLSESRVGKRLDALCLDPDGAVCSWVRGDDADPDLIRSTVEGGNAGFEDEGLDAVETGGISDRVPNLPGELSFDLPRGKGEEGRTAVIAAPDAPARLLMDQLDAKGVRIRRVMTVWHALAEAWGTPDRSGSRDSNNIVATDAPLSAVVAIDHDAARLIWVWTEDGSIIACGSSRLHHPRQENSLADVLDHDLSRLTADWLGWSAQLGLSPRRVVIVGRPGEHGLDAGEVGRGLTRAWPTATVDLMGIDDAIAESLRRTLDKEPVGSFAPLNNRPTRAHRSMYRWAALALLIAAGGVGVLAALLFGRAGSTRDDIAAITAQRTEVLSQIDPALVMSPFAPGELDARIQAIASRSQPLRFDNPRPLLPELETLSLVIAIPGVEIDEIDLTDTLVTIKIKVEEVELAEQLDQSLRAIGGTNLRWRDASLQSRRDKIEATYSASWTDGGDS